MLRITRHAYNEQRHEQSSQKQAQSLLTIVLLVSTLPTLPCNV